MYAIKSTETPGDWWSNDLGWTDDPHEATTFRNPACHRLPMGGEWCKAPKSRAAILADAAPDLAASLHRMVTLSRTQGVTDTEWESAMEAADAALVKAAAQS